MTQFLPACAVYAYRYALAERTGASDNACCSADTEFSYCKRDTNSGVPCSKCYGLPCPYWCVERGVSVYWWRTLIHGPYVKLLDYPSSMVSRSQE